MGEEKSPYRVSWVEGPYSSTYGEAGGIRLFSCSYSTDRADIAAGLPYALRSDLPGYRSRTWKVESVDAAKVRAEGVLRSFLEHVAPPQNEHDAPGGVS